MKVKTLCVILILFYGTVCSQESIKIVRVPQVSINDSLFYQMIYSVVNDAESCPITAELSSNILCKKYAFQNNELYIYWIAPFDDLVLFVEAVAGTDSWRITTINDMQILFLFSDSINFTVTDTSQIMINTRQRLTYEYVIYNDTVNISEQTAQSLCIKEEYSKESGEYLLQFRSPCVDISKANKIVKKGDKVLYYIKE